MTDTGAALWLLVIVLGLAAAATFALALRFFQEWVRIVRSGVNGQRLGTVRGVLRVLAFVLIGELAWLAQLGVRVVAGRPAGAAQTFLVAVALIGAFVGITASILWDYHLMDAMERDRRRP